MEDNDDDYFSDDGFESLPPGTLLQLEQNAYRATQAQKSAPSNPPQSNLPNAQSTFTDQSIRYGTSLKPPAHLHTGLTSEYGTLDIGELDAEVLDNDAGQTTTLAPASAFTGQLANRQIHPLGAEGQQHDDGDPSVAVQNNFLSGAMDFEEPDVPQHISDEFNLHMQKLVLENERINQELAAAKSMVETRSGEIAIIRSNQAKLTENYDRQLAALRKAMADAAEKHKGEVEAARAERKMLATENAFLRQDLNEEAMRINNLKTKNKPDEKAPPITPKKPRVLPFRDGFDDEEMIAVSPSKSTGTRSKGAATGKRKRAMSQGSPTPLQLSPQAERTVEVPGDAPDDIMIDVKYDQAPAKGDDHNVQAMKRIMNHRTFPNEDRDIELMARMALPSEPQRMLSSILLEETANRESGNYVMDYAFAIISLWSRSLNEKFFTPVPMFMGIIQFTLTLDVSLPASDLVDHLVPVLQESGDVNGVPRFKHWRRHLGQRRQTPRSELQPEVDGTEALSLLYDVAVGCLHVDDAIDNFWRHIRYDFILMMLNCSQPIPDIIMTLNLLSTGIRPDSFGSILDTEQDRTISENYIIDRVANLLTEMPQLDEGQKPYDPSEVCNMRLEALSFLATVAFNPMAPASDHGSVLIASHPTVLARLIRAMHDELDTLYSYLPEQEFHSAMVNGLMRLIYGVVQRHRENVDLQAQLGRVPGGKQKFIVVLTRLAFSDGPVLEAGIEDETVEMAHEILDDSVNPQEAEALLEAFPSAKRDD